MFTIDSLLEEYNLGSEEQRVLAGLAEHMNAVEPLFIDTFYLKLTNNAETAYFLKDEKTITRLKIKHSGWFLNLFSGKYDINYLRGLERIGQVHVKIGLPGHFVNSSMHLVRQFCTDQIAQLSISEGERHKAVRAINSIIDLNLDIMTASYRENELRAQIVSGHNVSKLLFFGTRMLFIFQLMMLFALAIITVLVVGMFFNDLYSVFYKDMRLGLLSALGSLLILWTILELMDKEVRHLKGGEFPITAFIGVAMAALIREILIMIFSPHSTDKDWIMVASLISLGIVYYLIKTCETRNGRV